MDRADRLQPDRLPDAGRARVPDALAAELLAFGLIGAFLRVGGVVDGDDKLLRAVRLQGACDVVGEGGIAASMRTHLLAVDPDRALPVHRAEVEQDMLPLPAARHVKGAPIPDALMNLLALADAGESRLERPGNQNALRQLVPR